MLSPPSNKSITPRTSLQCTMCACVLLPLLTCLRTPRHCTIDHSAPMTIWHRTTTPRHRLHAGQRLPQPEPPRVRTPLRPSPKHGRPLDGQPQRRPAAARGPGCARPRPNYAATCTPGNASGGPPLCAATGPTTPPVLPPACAPRARTPLERHGKRPALQSRGAGGARGRSCLPGLVGKDAPCSAPLGALFPTLALALNSTAVEAAHLRGRPVRQRLQALHAHLLARVPRRAARCATQWRRAVALRLQQRLQRAGLAPTRAGRCGGKTRLAAPLWSGISLVRAGRPTIAASQQKMAGPGSLPITAVHPDTMPSCSAAQYGAVHGVQRARACGCRRRRSRRHGASRARSRRCRPCCPACRTGRHARSGPPSPLCRRVTAAARTGGTRVLMPDLGSIQELARQAALGPASPTHRFRHASPGARIAGVTGCTPRSGPWWLAQSLQLAKTLWPAASPSTRAAAPTGAGANRIWPARRAA